MSRRVLALAAVLAASLAILLAPTPASAQVPQGSQAAALVGGPTAVCPPGSIGAVVPGGGTVNGVTVTGAGRCVPASADAEGDYTVDGVFGPLPFTAECDNPAGVVTTGGGVTVPAGTLVNGVAVLAPTNVTTPNTPVVFPGGRAAILNQVITTPTSVTRNAIVFVGGPTVGQVICGAAAYPLAVDVSGPSEAAAPLPGQAASDDSGPGTSLLLLGAVALVAIVVAQVVVARRMRPRGDTTA